MSKTNIDHRFSVAPMLDWTDRHCRYFLRLLSKHTVLYTEMVTTGAIIYGKGDYLGFNKQEHPVVLQLGGSNRQDMVTCAVKAQELGYDEININVGCPSDRVKNGSFGACLMATPEVVAECVRDMKANTDIPITVKCRIGIDDMDEDKDLSLFVEKVQEAGCEHFIIHARKAWLQGLSPKENRDIPPLNYERVYLLKRTHPNLNITINGGVCDLTETCEHLKQVDGVMMGRQVYSNPYLLSEVDRIVYKDNHSQTVSREKVIEQMTQYIVQQVNQGHRVWHVARHMLGLFQGQPGGKIWRRYLSQNGTGKNNDPYLLEAALDQVKSAQNKIKEEQLFFSENR